MDVKIKFFYFHDTVLSCNVRGKTGDGMERGSCPELHLCHSNGQCKPFCRVVGQLGNGTKRGDCESGQVCWRDGVCRSGMMRLCIISSLFIQFLIF